MNNLFFLRSWPSCVLHLDGDSFFASVAQALNPSLRNKPVITGAERGIVTAASYEARRLGVKRGVKLSDAKKNCPKLICVESDYESYSIFSKRMFEIMRRFTPAVEEYSIDEAFADLSGLRQLHRASYRDIGKQIKETVERELGITVSVGLSLTKSLAKIASNLRKPSGFVAVSGQHIQKLLEITPLEKVWGFGPNKVALLQKLGLKTAFDFVRQPEFFAKRYLGKPGLEIHQELSGKVVWPVSTEEKTTYGSISKTKTFTPPSSEQSFVYAQALRNLEAACYKARLFNLSAKRISLFLKKQTFESVGTEIRLSNASSTPLDLNHLLKEMFESLYQPGVLYRATGVTLSELEAVNQQQYSLFEDPLQNLKTEQLTKTIDYINAKYGRHKVHLAETLPVYQKQRPISETFRTSVLKFGVF